MELVGAVNLVRRQIGVHFYIVRDSTCKQKPTYEGGSRADNFHIFFQGHTT